MKAADVRRRSLATRLTAFLPVAVVVLLVSLSMRGGALPAPSTGWLSVSPDSFSTVTAADADARASATPPAPRRRGSVVFTCPNGRLGLHVVHTRFLISQADAGILFAATRLHLMETFMAPSLAAQTSLDYVIYASYDPDLPAATIQAFKDTLALVPVHTVLHGEGDTNGMALGLRELAEELESEDPRVKDVEIYVMTRLDVDDAGHVGAVAAAQEFACTGAIKEGHGATLEEEDRAKKATAKKGGSSKDRSDEDSSESDPAAAAAAAAAERAHRPVRAMYLVNGTLWWPSHKHPLGLLRVSRPNWKLFQNLAVVQTMVLTGREFVKRCALDVYAYPHYDPTKLEGLEDPRCAETFDFDARRDVYRWAPPRGEFGWLYSKTMSSWTATIFDHRKSTVAIEMDLDRLAASFGVDRAGLAVANLMFAGFAKEGAGLLENSTELKIERRRARRSLLANAA